ncbi:MAG: hypothetical protein HON70_41530, partial [Lentisphaerae bacterium]|nr:hypothetical protein [Lentisphaerota bacterium]
TLSIRVDLDNGGQQLKWPRPDPPAWFSTWLAIPPDTRLTMDYCRQGIGWNLHKSPQALAGSAGKVFTRATASARQTQQFLPQKSPELDALLARLGRLRDRLKMAAAKGAEGLLDAKALWLDMRLTARAIVLASPALDLQEIAFIQRHSAHSHRNITGSQYPWVHKPGGGITVKNGLAPSGQLQNVLGDQLGPGHVHGMDLSWAADRVVFAYARQPGWPPTWDTIRGQHAFELRKTQPPTHIFEVKLDGSGLRQLTNDPLWSDFEPTYCANDDVVFASDRSGRSSECGSFSADHTVINIYRVSANGKGIRKLSDNKDIDRYPHSLDNGLIAYTRWEYQERHFLEVHALWTVRPDGTMADALANQHMRAPYGLRDARSVPNTQKLVAIATGHHTFAYGPVVLVDPKKGINASAAVTSLTPFVKPQEGPMTKGRTPSGGVPDRGGLYQTPWALSDTCFLVSYSYARPPSNTSGGRNAANFAIYLIDVFGNKELVHRDPIFSAAFPMPVRTRPRPPVIPDNAIEPNARPTCVVADVYSDLPGIDRGEARFLRISQRVGWPLDGETGAKRWIPGNAWTRRFGYWSWAPARVIGTVPVETDGSAHFHVPAGVALYFQLLDKDQMELRRMRSHIAFQEGETRGCNGCHESQLRAPPRTARVPAALLRPASVPSPPPWGADRLLGYEWLIQPIFERNCVRCHGPNASAAGLDLSNTRAEGGFMQSFRSLFGQRPLPPDGSTGKSPMTRASVLVSVADRLSGSAVSAPKAFGSHRSRLIEVLQSDEKHAKRVTLTDSEWLALVTWIDANAPYHDTFYQKRPPGDGPPVRNVTVRLTPTQ